MHYFLRNILKFSLGIVFPLFIIGVLYLFLDPFKVVKSYESFYKDDAPARVGLNKDYVSTMTFINNNEGNYNSFILGNSRSIFYEIDDWKIYIEPDVKAFHFDASGESLWAIHKKINFIDNQGNNIDNILLVLDYTTILQDQPKKGHLHITSPPLVNYSNRFEFHKTFFLTFLKPKFFYTYLDFKLTGRLKPYMKKNYLLDDIPLDYDVSTNELQFNYFENLIETNKYYTEERMKVFYERDSKERDYPQSIYENQKAIFKDIQQVIKKHNSDIKIIINPLYDQKKINKEDLNYLIRVFGKENVFDFSGINEFTNDYRNYYEEIHYRPHIARQILENIYNK